MSVDTRTDVLGRALAEHAGVADFAVTPLSAEGDREVVAVVVLTEMCSVLDVREDLWQQVGEGGVEPVVLAVPELPDHGRLDESWVRRELADSPSASRYEPPATALEADLAATLALVLDRPRVGVLDDFVDLGGDSVLAVAFVAAVQEAHGVPLTLMELFGAGTVRQVAHLVEERLAAAGPGRG